MLSSRASDDICEIPPGEAARIAVAGSSFIARSMNVTPRPAVMSDATMTAIGRAAFLTSSNESEVT